MARIGINTGSAANDNTGSTLRAAGGIINDNFSEIYTYFGDGTNLTSIGGTWAVTSVGIHTLKNVGIGTTNPRFALEVGAVGTSGTTLFVNGDARVTGILTIGTASITLNGATNIINVGTGITINGSTGIISATSIVLGGTTLTGAAVTSITAGSGISVDQSTGNVTITATGGGGSSQWVTTAAGIHTLSNVCIGTTNPTSALTVTGNALVTGVVTATTFNSNADITIYGIRVGRGEGANAFNTVVGNGALNNSNSGNYNTAYGYQSLYSNTTGYQNTAIGANALRDNNTGSNNTANGISALLSNTTGDFNTANGGGALLSNTTGQENTANGYGALNATTGSKNSAFGANAGTLITTGGKNTILGTYNGNQNGLDIRTSNNNVVLSDGDGNIRFYANSSGNVGLGTTNPTSKLTVSGDALINGLTVGLGGSVVTSNTAIGSSALYSNTTGSDNVANGYWALYSNTTGNYNTGIGFESLESNITANSNTGIGYRTLFTNRYGTQNVAIGLQSLFALDGGGYNTATGTSSLAFVVTGANNTATGYGSLNETTASNNTGIGYLSGSSITTGSKNTLLGSYTGNQNGLDIRTSSNNVVLSDGDGNIRFYANSSGNVGLGTTNPTEKLTVVGVTSSTLFYGDASYTTSGRWTLGANGAADYTFTGIGFTQTTNDPVLYLARGRVYEFVNNSGGGHPFEIRTSNNGSAYSNGVTNNAAASGVIRFEVPFNAPNTLYYQCTNHSGMGNTISVYPSTI